jgi:hypothetical protein
MGKNIAIIGATGTGKTTDAIEIGESIDFEQKLVFDINKEYTEIPGYNSVYEKRPDFIQRALKLQNSLIIFDEATIFFRHGKNSDDILELMLRRRHLNNVCIFNFHALGQIPLFIVHYIDEMILHHTNDNKNGVNRFEGREEIEEAFNELFEMRNGQKLDALEKSNPALFKEIKHKSIFIKTAM